ncbi:hypothetical protein N7E81_07680 [Reichenbachiella carrageenanivorans]|uniref:Stress responsive A/B Barrel Domain n=1 Tax=Reichenbachiella carrageenanivorans TaxID=2979869 RepID=A0ABY6D4A6_9BACT|nr:hypothetical protein [Reichenbachiella carrageenanivorans]UXX80977.1 hypothetical protein N7E81_07680 [Reichenbachiella carrageenanivorans]
MSYKLRFIQRFQLDKTAEFMAIEKQFAAFETQYPDFPKGRRYVPHVGSLPVNTLIWECDFDTLDELHCAHDFLMKDDRHEDLFQVQSVYLLEAYTEIYRPYDS